MVRRSRVKKSPVVGLGLCIDCLATGLVTRRPARRPGPRCATCQRARKQKTRSAAHDKYVLETYGITGEEYWAIYEAQGGVCFICQRARGTVKRLSVDHDHKTGEVRGLLCSPCNRDVIGHLRDDVLALARAIDYLEFPPARAVLTPRKWKI